MSAPALGHPADAIVGRAQAKAAVSAADKARAAELFKKSADAYRQGDFKQAIALLDEAYALDPSPVLTYNRARAAEGLGNIDEAIAGYEKFLSEEPNAADRGAIEQRLTTLRRQRDERAALERERDARREAPPVQPAQQAPPPPPTMPEHAERPPSHSVMPYVVGGVGVAGLAAGTVFGMLALSKKDDAVSEPVQQRSMDLKDSADGLAGASTVSLIVGGVLLAAGVTWWMLDHGVFSKKNGSAKLVLPRSVAGLGVTFP